MDNTMFKSAPDKTRSLGLVAIMVVGMLAGVLVATTASGEEFASVGTIADQNQAYALDLDEDRVQFTLAAEDGASQPALSLALYDPQDEFFASFDLAGDGDDVEVLADQPGHWVIFVTKARQATLDVAIETDAEENTTTELASLDVKEVEHSVASQDGGPLDEQIALRLDTRPAVAFLEVRGEVSDLDAQVTTDKGTVFSVEDATKNETSDGIQTQSGSYMVAADNLIAGTYKVDAQAQDLTGELVLVHQTYDRGELASSPETPDAPELPEDNGSVVAELEEHEPILVDTHGQDTLVLQIHKENSARLYLYNSSDQVTQIVQVEDEHSHDHGDENTSDLRAVEIELAEPGEYVLFPVHIDDDEEVPTKVILPDVDSAAQATTLELEETEVVLTDEETNKSTVLEGGLVGLAVHRSQSSVEFDRELTITGPLGEIAHIEEEMALFGGSFYWGYEVHEDRFSAGNFTVTSESGESMPLGFDDSETRVLLVSYVR